MKLSSTYHDSKVSKTNIMKVSGPADIRGVVPSRVLSGSTVAAKNVSPFRTGNHSE